ncbi:tetratricopeptide repeat protein [Aliiroseovarius sp. PTFE2010]|uniref:tetratricopeptide repeat protein n=1 Tax=Aliiroseovarius sp. PTFE2010 TaxID=3417190 RepID=UPI003CEF73D4
MRHISLISLCLAGALALSACENHEKMDVERAAAKGVNVIDESNLNDVMLNAADPNEAVAYFQRTEAENPDRVDLKRGLAKALIRAKRIPEAEAAWADTVAHKDSEPEDKVNYADALIRNGNWETAETVLNDIPPTHETYKRYRLEAMVADSNEEWKKADSFYEIAAGQTTKPSGVYNNWGYSKLTRGDFKGAEEMFARALTYNPSLFTAKNNLVLARGAQRKYDLPVIQMTQVERAQLLHTLALAAIKQGDVSTGKGLLTSAIETHPQHFEAAVRSLDALEANVTR